MSLAVLAAVAALIAPATVAHAAPAHDAPGTLTESVAPDTVALVPGAAESHRITYWTRTSLDEPAQSSGLVFVPEGAAPDGGWPVIAWEHGTVGLASDCAPSVSGMYPEYTQMLTHWLDAGYAVVASDYIGLGTPGPHAYLDGEAEAHASIDAIRAARTVVPALSSRWAAVGHSQGGQAALFTGAKATDYAPELDYRGVAAYAPGASVVDLMLLAGRPGLPDLLPSVTKAYGTYALLGLKNARPDFDLDGYLTPLGKEVVGDAGRLCLDAMMERIENVNMSDVLSRPLEEGDFTATARPVMDIPVSGYDRPVFIAQGALDYDVPAPLVWNLIEQLEANDVQPIVRNYPLDEHMTLLRSAEPAVDDFLANILD